MFNDIYNKADIKNIHIYFLFVDPFVLIDLLVKEDKKDEKVCKNIFVFNICVGSC